MEKHVAPGQTLTCGTWRAGRDVPCQATWPLTCSWDSVLSPDHHCNSWAFICRLWQEAPTCLRAPSPPRRATWGMAYPLLSLRASLKPLGPRSAQLSNESSTSEPLGSWGAGGFLRLVLGLLQSQAHLDSRRKGVGTAESRRRWHTSLSKLGGHLEEVLGEAGR